MSKKVVYNHKPDPIVRITEWKKDPLGRNLMVSQTSNGKTIYRSKTVDKMIAGGLFKKKEKK
jgi:hypothetical protein